MSGGRRLNPWDQSISEMPERPRHNAITFPVILTEAGLQRCGIYFSGKIRFTAINIFRKATLEIPYIMIVCLILMPTENLKTRCTNVT